LPTALAGGFEDMIWSFSQMHKLG